MKTHFLFKYLLFIEGAVLYSMQISAIKNSTNYVSTLVGTQSKFELLAGSTYPVAALPWGMNFWAPQTGKMDDGWAYTYNTDKIRGFKQAHQPGSWMNGYGQFSVMSITGGLIFDRDQRASQFSHKVEIAKPYYYKVYLADRDITTGLIPTECTIILRLTYLETKNAHVATDTLDKGSYVKVIPKENETIDYSIKDSGEVPENFKNYFVIQFDRPFTSTSGMKENNIPPNETRAQGNHTGAITGFATQKGETVHVRVVSSFINCEQAELNLKGLGKDSFDQLVTKGKGIWNREMSKIDAEDDNIDNLRAFYSCLHCSMLFPYSFYEIDVKGQVVYYNPYNGKILLGYMSTDTGFWDTLRCLFLFPDLMYPSMDQRMQEGLVNAYPESGSLPEWTSLGHHDHMVGNNSVSVVADAYIKGPRRYDIETPWEVLKYGVNAYLHGTTLGHSAYDAYNKLGYVPDNIGTGQNVARTLEYMYNDWTIYTLGKKLGRPVGEINIFKQRALNYKDVHHPKRKLIMGKDDKGVFNPRFDAIDWSGEFCEDNSRHWSLRIFHDPQRLIDLVGGKKGLNNMMNSVSIIPGKQGMGSRGMIYEMREVQVTNMGQRAHGNQSIQHMVYLYDYLGEPRKAQHWVREIVDKLYTTGPDGYRDDGDNGQTSAWYAFSALGFYPVYPEADQYILGTLLFKLAELHLESGEIVTIRTSDNSIDNRYVKDMKVNGRAFTRNYLTHDQLLKGANIQYQMSPTPNERRGATERDIPYSLSFE